VTDDAAAPARTAPPWWAVLLTALAIAGLAFAIGRFSTFGDAGAPPTTDSPEAGFARDMQVHHAQAVEMAMDIYRTTDDEGVRTLAYDIATAQSAQRGELYGWLVSWGLPQAGGPAMAWMESGGEHAHGSDAPASDDEDPHAAMGMATAAELAELRSQTGTTADCTFLRLMIRHHQGALPMAEALLRLGDEPRALQVAGAVVQTQSAELELMRSLQARLGCSG
jgi:uncharacterized protein (DUF305 family)